MIYFTALFGLDDVNDTLLVEEAPLDRRVYLAEENSGSYVRFGSSSGYMHSAVGSVSDNIFGFVLPANIELWGIGTQSTSGLRVMVTSLG